MSQLLVVVIQSRLLYCNIHKCYNFCWTTIKKFKQKMRPFLKARYVFILFLVLNLSLTKERSHFNYPVFRSSWNCICSSCITICSCSTAKSPEHFWWFSHAYQSSQPQFGVKDWWQVCPEDTPLSFPNDIVPKQLACEVNAILKTKLSSHAMILQE